MAFNNLEDMVRKYREEAGLDADLPSEIQQEFASRIPKSDPNYDVHVSNETLKMRGREDSLPSAAGMSDMPEKSKLDYSVEEDTPLPTPEVIPPVVEKSDSIASASKTPDTTVKDLFPVTDNDSATRAAEMAALDKKRKLNIIPQLAAGFGDAVAAGVSAKGGNMPMNALDNMMKRQDADYDTQKKGIEQKLRNDPNSDISKQYQELVARFLQKEPGDPALLGLTANQIAEKIPQVEKIATLRQQEELKREQMEANKESRLMRQQMAQGKVDEKAQAVAEKKEASVRDAAAQAGTIRGTIKDIINRDLVGFDTAGPTGSKWLAPLDYPDLAAKLDTIGSNIAFATLNKLRQTSPTGGAVGQVSDKDMALLMSVKGSLKQEQSPAQLKETLKRLDEIYQKVEGYDAEITAPWKDKSSTTPQAKKSKGGYSYQVEP